MRSRVHTWELLNLHFAGQRRHIVIFGIGDNRTRTVCSRLQPKSQVHIYPSFDKARQLPVEDVYLVAPLSGIHQIFFLIEDGKDKGHRTQVVVSVFVKMQGRRIQMREQGQLACVALPSAEFSVQRDR
jgi:hypothetical protein